MFENMKMLGAMAGLMKNADKVKEGVARVRASMEATTVQGEAGAGAARATVSGTMRVISVELSPGLVVGMAADEKTRALASSLIAEAVNNALAMAQAKMKQAVDQEARALGFEGGLGDILSGVAGI